ncbi:MAG TPA: type I phosphomannose isomerase catalytic subunit [Symbiobacteriaceae bacterium]|jgi:mannose-6-phosphate isomerase
MVPLYPLRLQPIFKERVWGGRALEAFYGSGLPAGAIGEAWVLGEHAQGTSVVTNGPLAGSDLTALRLAYGPALLGSKSAPAPGGRCPLLIKLLDARDDLSVQVHPADGDPRLPPGEPGKTEMWYVLSADPGASIVYGLAEGVDAGAFTKAVRSGETMRCLRKLRVQPGDVFYVPSGTIHALGAGVVVAEVQQSSDTVYRVYDYDRLGLDGKPRDLHVERALEVTSYAAPPAVVRSEEPPLNRWQPLVCSPYFVVELGRCETAWETATDPGGFEALLVVEGQGAIAWDGVEGKIGAETIGKGDTLLIPAALPAYRLTGALTVLRSRLP